MPLLFPPTPHCSHQLMVGDITENMRRCVHTGGKILPLLSKGPHLLLMHLQLFLDKAADLVEGGSPCGLQAPARLHDAVPAGPHRDREVVGAAVGVCSPRLFPAACCMSGTHAETTEPFFQKTHGECSAPGNGEHWSGWSKLINKKLYAIKTSGLHSLPPVAYSGLSYNHRVKRS